MSTLWIERNRKLGVSHRLDDDSAQVPAGQHWHTTTFRWLIAYAVIFSACFMALLGLIEYSVTGAMERETDSGLRWQLRYFDSRSDSALPEAIAERIAHGGLLHNHYGLFGPNGVHRAGDIRQQPPFAHLDRVGQAHEHSTGSNVTLLVEEDRRSLRAMAESRPNGSILIVARTLSDVRHVRSELTRALLIGGVVGLSASVLGGLLIGLRQVRRVASMRKATAAIAAGELALRLPVHGNDELDMLAQLVNRMLDEVERLMTEVKLASDGIAHDLRTPLARLRLSLLKAHAAAGELNAESLQSILTASRDDVDGLIARFSAMLRIAELGTRQRRAAFAKVSLAPLIEDLCDLYGPLIEEKQMQLRTSIEQVDDVWADRGLLFEAFSNLLDNAVKFSPEGGSVEVRLCRGIHGPTVVISDSGPGIPEDERKLVLGSFYRGRYTRHVSGSGLGLGIVSAIVRLHDFALKLDGSEKGAILYVECWSHDFGEHESH